jgi:hypothetical protein
MEENKKRIFGRPPGKKSLGSPMRSWKENTRTDLGEMGYKHVKQDVLAQNRLILKAMELEALQQ